MNDRVQRLRRDLTEPVAPPTCPTGYRVRTFAADDAPTVHRLLEVGYAQGGGHIGAFEEWWPSLRDDDEFDPDLCFLAVNERQDIVGVAQCWTSAFIKDLVVHPTSASARNRGGTAEESILGISASGREARRFESSGGQSYGSSPLV